MMPGLASASNTRRPSGAAYVTITALGGSCCSSCGCTRSSRDRCEVLAVDELLLAARDVLIPHAVLVLRPAVIDRESDVPRDRLESLLRDALKWPNGAKASWRLRPRPVLRA
jgi:hypothetical protein